MTKEEAKALLGQANELMSVQQYEEAYGMLEQVDEAFPNSGRVLQQRTVCLIGMARLTEAEETCERLSRVPGGEKAGALKERIVAARQRREAPTPQSPPQPPAGAAPAGAENEFLVDTVTPVSAGETCVTGHVLKGVFYKGATVSVLTPSGVPLLAPIERIGTRDAPLNIVREGTVTTMILKIEAQHIALGAKLTSTTSGDSYAKTMLVETDRGAAQTPKSAAVAPPKSLQEAQRLVMQRKFPEAKEALTGLLSSDPNDYHTHQLLARTYLEAGPDLRDPKLSLEHVMRAYECGGHDDPTVLDVLAHAMGANGQEAHGLRHLERLFDIAQTIREKDACAKRINEYRARYNLPDVWQFVDGFGEVVFDSSDLDQIRRAIEGNSIPDSAMCRKNKTGKLMPMEDTIAKLDPAIAALFKKKGGLFASIFSFFGVWRKRR